MNELLTLTIAPGIVWALLVFLRVPAATLILSILVGKLFSEELAPKLHGVDMMANFSSGQLQLGLLLLPVILSVILTRSRVSKTRILSNAVVLAFASVSLILFCLPYVDIESKLGANGRSIIDAYQAYIVCATGGLALLSAWSPDLKLGHRGRHHK